MQTLPPRLTPTDPANGDWPTDMPPERRGHGWLRRHLPFVAIFLIAAYLITLNVRTPFQAAHEDNGTVFASIAINQQRLGFGVTKGQDYLDQEAIGALVPAGVDAGDEFTYFRYGDVHPEVYADHPPLLGLTIAGSFAMFGYHFWSERLVVILYALAGLVLFYLLTFRLFGPGVARFAAFLYATFPILAYYGRNVAHESPTLFWGLLLLTAYFRWRDADRHRAGWATVMVVATGIGGFYGWPMFYGATILFGLDWATRRRFDRRLFLLTAVPAVVTFLLVIGQIDWALGGNLTKLVDIFEHRIAGGDDTSPTAVSTAGWLGNVSHWNAEDFGQWTQLVLPLAAFFVARRFAAERWSPRLFMLTFAGAWGLSHILIFRNGAYVHDYWQFYLLPFYALAIGWAVADTAHRYLTSAPARITALTATGLIVFCLNLATILSLYATTAHGLVPVKPVIDIW